MHELTDTRGTSEGSVEIVPIVNVLCFFDASALLRTHPLTMYFESRLRGKELSARDAVNRGLEKNQAKGS